MSRFEIDWPCGVVSTLSMWAIRFETVHSDPREVVRAVGRVSSPLAARERVGRVSSSRGSLSPPPPNETACELGETPRNDDARRRPHPCGKGKGHRVKGVSQRGHPDDDVLGREAQHQSGRHDGVRQRPEIGVTGGVVEKHLSSCQKEKGRRPRHLL